MPFTLPRSERLRSMKAIRRMFGEGSGGFVYPFRYVFLATGGSGQSDAVAGGDGLPRHDAATAGGIEVMFSVPKKFHKRANRRNLLKRRTREAYRLNRGRLGSAVAQRGVRVDMALIYSTKECHSYKTIENAVQRILEQVGSRI